MDRGNIDQNPAYVEITPDFYCDETGEPFVKCIECETDLIDSQEQYFIEKAKRRYPNTQETLTIFEFAICLSCTTKLNQSLSQESLRKITEFQTNLLRNSHYASSERFTTSSSSENVLDTCLFTGNKISMCDEYQLVGAFRGDKMILHDLPFAISGEVIEAMSEILSEQTKEEFDGFVSKHFTGPPELQELWGKPKLIHI